MRALFFGSPAFAVPCLDALAELADVACVFSQPDRPAGRGLALTPPPVKSRALELGLRVEQPTKVRTPEFAELVRSFGADVAVVVAYGRILPKAVLDAPRTGCLNVHASLLPRWRGAAPIQWSVVSGDAVTGVTLMQMDEGLDTGPMIATRTLAIEPNETSGELSERLSRLGAALVTEELANAVNGVLPRVAQPEHGITHARLLEKSDGILDFAESAVAVHDRARGMTPWPGAQTTFAGQPLKVHVTRVVARDGVFGAQGTVVRAEGDDLHVACGRGVIAFLELQESGRKRVSARQFLSGRTLAAGTRFGDAP